MRSQPDSHACIPEHSARPFAYELGLPVSIQWAVLFFKYTHSSGTCYAVNIDFHHSETTEAQNDFAAGRRQHDDRGMLIFVMRSSRRRESLEPGGHQGGI